MRTRELSNGEEMIDERTGTYTRCYRAGSI